MFFPIVLIVSFFDGYWHAWKEFNKFLPEKLRTNYIVFLYEELGRNLEEF